MGSFQNDKGVEIHAGSCTIKVEDDETLLHEVDAEMARGVKIPEKISSAQQTTPIPASASTMATIIPPQTSSLEVVEEKDEAIVGRLEDLEENVDRLNHIIRDTEICLHQVTRYCPFSIRYKQTGYYIMSFTFANFNILCQMTFAVLFAPG